MKSYSLLKFFTLTLLFWQVAETAISKDPCLKQQSFWSFDKEGKENNIFARKKRQFYFVKDELIWCQGDEKKGSYKTEIFKKIETTVKNSRYYISIELKNKARGRNILTLSTPCTNQCKKQLTRDSSTQRFINIVNNYIAASETKISYEELKKIYDKKTNKDFNLLGKLSHLSIKDLENLLAKNLVKFKSKFSKKYLAKRLKDQSHIKIITNAHVQDRMIVFAKDQSATGNAHIQMAASQFNGAEHTSQNDFSIPKSAILEYKNDRTQGPYCQMANPFNAEYLLSLAATSKNRKGFHGFKKDLSSKGLLSLSEKIQNGYFLFKKEEIPKITDLMQKYYTDIKSTVVEKMPVYGKIIDGSNYLYKASSYGKVTMIAVSAVPTSSYGNPSKESTKEIQRAAQRAAFGVTVLQGVNEWLQMLKEKNYDLAKTKNLTVHFTLPGLGAFNNDEAIILETMKETVLKYARDIPLSFTVEVFGSKASNLLEKTVLEINKGLGLGTST